MIRILALIGGLCGAGTLSQFPEFSQQYYQRLAGAVDELRPIALTVDVTARAQGLTRREALNQLQGSDMADNLRENLAVSVRRYDRLSAAEARMADAGPLGRLAQPWNFADSEIFSGTLDDYQPALPLTGPGLISAGIGFGGAWLLVLALFGGLKRLLFGRGRLA